jgi:hypothetical protein
LVTDVGHSPEAAAVCVVPSPNRYMTREDLRHVDERVVWNRSDHVLDVLLKGLWFTIYWLLYCLKENVRVSIVKQTHLEQLLRRHFKAADC